MNEQLKYKYLYAFAFGDGCLENTKNNQNSRLRIEHVSRNTDYCDWKTSILENITNVTQTTYYREDKNQSFTRIITARHPIYTKLRERLYLHGRKTIDPHIEAFLDWEFLAVLYQDDGYLSFNQYGSPQILLCTECFTWAEQKMLRDWMAEKLELHWEVVKHTNGFRLRLKGKYIPYFIENVKAYIVPSMLYKIRKFECEAPAKDEEPVRSSEESEGLDESLGLRT